MAPPHSPSAAKGKKGPSDAVLQKQKYERSLRSAADKYRVDKAAGRKVTLKRTATDFSVAWTTLRDRVNGAKSRAEAWKDMQVLTWEQERCIAEFCLKVADMGFPLRIPYALEMAREMASSSAPNPDDPKTQHQTRIGESWFQRFIQRHPTLNSKFLGRMEKQRFYAENPFTMHDFFRKLGELFREMPDLRPEDIFNMDEKGFMIGMSQKVRVIARKGAKNRHLRSIHNRKLLTVIEVVSADGKAHPPFIIFRGEHITYGNIAHAEVNGEATFVHSSKGWTNYEIGLEWLHHFEETCPGKDGRWRILIMDGHSSHVNYDFLRYCLNHKIRPVCLPPHSTHKLQPLDVGLFQPLSRAYTEALDRHQANHDNINQGDFYGLLRIARPKAYTEKNIKEAFAATGIWPLNSRRVIEPASRTITRSPPRPSRPDAPQPRLPPPTPRTSRSGHHLQRRAHTLLNQQEASGSFNMVEIREIIDTLAKGLEIGIAQKEIAQFNERELRKQKHSQDESVPPGRSTKDQKWKGLGQVIKEKDVAELHRVQQEREAAKQARAARGRGRGRGRGQGRGRAGAQVEKSVAFAEAGSSGEPAAEDEDTIVWECFDEEPRQTREKRTDWVVDRPAEVTTRSGRVSRRRVVN